MNRLAWIVAVLCLALSGTAAEAHSNLVRSEPAKDVTVKQPPNELRIWFSEPLKVGLSTVEVRNIAGQQVDRKDLQVDAQTPKLIHLSFDRPLGPGAYRVSWTAVAEDMHVAKGAFTFRVAP